MADLRAEIVQEVRQAAQTQARQVHTCAVCLQQQRLLVAVLRTLFQQSVEVYLLDMQS